MLRRGLRPHLSDAEMVANYEGSLVKLGIGASVANSGAEAG